MNIDKECFMVDLRCQNQGVGTRNFLETAPIFINSAFAKFCSSFVNKILYLEST